MPIAHVHVRGYRSLRDVYLPLSPCTLVVGPNGSGKTNLYRSVQLLAEAAAGRLGRSIADEGGLQSVVWAGDRRKDERSGVGVEVGWADAVASRVTASRVGLRRQAGATALVSAAE